MKHILVVFLVTVLLSACASTPALIPPAITDTPVPALTATPLPTEPLLPASTVDINTPKPSNTVTITPSNPPTALAEASLTPTATMIPISDSDNFRLDLQEQGYTLFSSSSTIGPGGYVFSAYIFLDSTFGTRTPPRPYRETQDTEGCRIAFYRWDGEENMFLYSFSGAQYTEKSAYTGYPISCFPVVWEDPFTWSGYASPTQEDLEPINAKGSWSDLNQNGMPEFAIKYHYCSNACENYGVISVHLYEIKTTSKVVDITADLPGIIEPIKGLVHSTDPLDFYVFDPTLEYCYKWCTLETFWIYAWNGEQFVDVTPKYVDEYRAKGERLIASLEQKETVSFREWDFLEILFVYEKANLRQEGLDHFLEITDPARWPNADPWEQCWLQGARAQALEDYAIGRPFQFPIFRFQSFAEPIWEVEDTVEYFVGTPYDLSACVALLPPPTPQP